MLLKAGDGFAHSHYWGAEGAHGGVTAGSEGARRAPFLPPAASRFLRRRSVQLGGLVVLALAAWLALALISYAPGDASFNTANSRAIANSAGLPGAYAADLLLQAVGAASALLVAIVAAWARVSERSTYYFEKPCESCEGLSPE